MQTFARSICVTTRVLSVPVCNNVGGAAKTDLKCEQSCCVSAALNINMIQLQLTQTVSLPWKYDGSNESSIDKLTVKTVSSIQQHPC